jgi:hypothetical protein
MILQLRIPSLLRNRYSLTEVWRLPSKGAISASKYTIFSTDEFIEEIVAFELYLYNAEGSIFSSSSHESIHISRAACRICEKISSHMAFCIASCGDKHRLHLSSTVLRISSGSFTTPRERFANKPRGEDILCLVKKSQPQTMIS